MENLTEALETLQKDFTTKKQEAKEKLVKFPSDMCMHGKDANNAGKEVRNSPNQSRKGLLWQTGGNIWRNALCSVSHLSLWLMYLIINLHTCYAFARDTLGLKPVRRGSLEPLNPLKRPMLRAEWVIWIFTNHFAMFCLPLISSDPLGIKRGSLEPLQTTGSIGRARYVAMSKTNRRRSTLRGDITDC